VVETPYSFRGQSALIRELASFFYPGGCAS
jgi:hypothetical protein